MVRLFLAAVAVLALAACSIPVAVPADDASATRSAAPTPDAPAAPYSTAAPTVSDPAPAPGNRKIAKLSVTTEGPATITLSQNGHETRQDITGPWERTIELTDLPTDLSLTVEADRAGAVGCEIEADGVSINNMSSGGSVTATCSTTVR